MSFCWSGLRRDLIILFRYWQIMFMAFLLYYGLSSLGGWEGDFFTHAFLSSIFFTPFFYLVLKIRDNIILYARRLALLSGNTYFFVKQCKDVDNILRKAEEGVKKADEIEKKKLKDNVEIDNTKLFKDCEGSDEE